jgi:peptide/nickel transport system permease protein
MNNLKNTFKQIFSYPSAVAGVIVILILVGVAIYTLITIPYSKVVTLWRGSEDTWYANPKYAPPAWFNLFTKKKLAESFDMKQDNPNVTTVSEDRGQNTTRITVTFNFDYEYDTFPQELSLYLRPTFKEKQPFVSIAMDTPDGREEQVTNFALSADQTYRFSQDTKLTKKLKGTQGQIGLLADPNSDPANPTPLKGPYKLVLTITTFEPDANVNAEFVLYGQVYGWAGTDHLRRDLGVALLWGVPIALVFGLLGALGTNVLSMVFAAIGSWYGGIVDGIIQRITEVNLVLPFLSILIMVGTFYSRSIWVILGVTILLSIFTGNVKSYRAIFLQVKESTYIEAARTYGASNFRIIFVYLIPRMIPLLIPGLVSSVPTFVFLEASLAVLGLGDPVLPTWGKVINDAYVNGALYKGYYYWITEPAVLLVITGLGFAMLGFALDRIFNPRLRTV